MNILLLGGGGREHAFAWKLNQSPLCDKLFIAPGNAGTAEVGKNLDLSPTDFEAVRETVLNRHIDIVLVGPEQPLVEGIWDYFQEDPSLQHVMLVGPSREGARLEGSKAYAKEFMQEYGIPTADYRSFTASQEADAFAFIDQLSPPIVLKADGLAAGKGVLICPEREEAKKELREMWSGRFGEAGETVVIEEFLKGIEFSVFVLTDGKQYQILPVAKDYKRVGEGDTGPNTGGMGCVSPVPFVDEELMEKVRQRVIEPTLKGIQERRLAYEGFLFLGLMNVDGDPFVIEYNCRMGDPETQVVLPRMKNDLLVTLIAMKKEKLSQLNLEEDPRTAAAVILVSGGYPGTYEKGKHIHQVQEVKDSLVFHAGTHAHKGGLQTNGGRVLALTSLADSIEEAVNRSMHNAEVVKFEGKNYRKDIGRDLMKRD